MELTRLRAVVTGGARGIGYETSRRLLAEGCAVTLWDRDEKALTEAAESLRQFFRSGTSGQGPVLYHHIGDITDGETVIALAAATDREMGGVDILINNAGYLSGGNFLDKPVEDWVKTIDVNVTAVLRTIHVFLPAMYERNMGRIVNISSAAGVLGVSGLAAYSSSKWAVWGLTESLRHEALNLGKTGVKFASVHPSYVAEGLFAGARMRGLGGLIVPSIKNHDVVAEAIVEKALKQGKNVVMRPRSVRTATLLRGLLPDPVFQRVLRLLNVHTSMSTWRGRNHETETGR